MYTVELYCSRACCIFWHTAPASQNPLMQSVAREQVRLSGIGLDTTTWPSRFNEVLASIGAQKVVEGVHGDSEAWMRAWESKVGTLLWLKYEGNPRDQACDHRQHVAYAQWLRTNSAPHHPPLLPISKLARAYHSNISSSSDSAHTSWVFMSCGSRG